MNQDEKETYGEKVRNARIKLKMTQRQFAEECGVSFGTIAMIETGKVKSLGEKVMNRIESYLSENQVNISRQVTRNKLTGDQTINWHNTQDISPILNQISNIVSKEDFFERITKISEAAGCTLSDAALVIFHQALKK